MGKVMIIRDHKIIKGSIGELYQQVIIDWRGQEWKIMVTDNSITEKTTAHIWDNDDWRPFDDRELNESIIHSELKLGKLVKLKYKVQ
jgi:hypothetical protein